MPGRIPAEAGRLPPACVDASPGVAPSYGPRRGEAEEELPLASAAPLAFSRGRWPRSDLVSAQYLPVPPPAPAGAARQPCPPRHGTARCQEGGTSFLLFIALGSYLGMPGAAGEGGKRRKTKVRRRAGKLPALAGPVDEASCLWRL